MVSATAYCHSILTTTSERGEPLDHTPRGGKVWYRFSAFCLTSEGSRFFALLASFAIGDNESSIKIGEFSSTLENKGTGKQQMGDDACRSWADECSEPGVRIPDVLERLINGLHLKATHSWSGTAKPMLVKHLSVYFLVDKIVNSQDILQAFDDAGTNIDGITSIQRKSSNCTWVVSCDHQFAKEAALEFASIEIGGVDGLFGGLQEPFGSRKNLPSASGIA